MNKNKKDPIVHLVYPKLTGFLFILILVSIGVLIYVQDLLPPEIPLYYGSTTGADQLGVSIEIIIPQIIALTVLVINTAISYLAKEEFIKKILFFTSFTCIIISLIATTKVILLVGNI